MLLWSETRVGTCAYGSRSKLQANYMVKYEHVSCVDRQASSGHVFEDSILSISI